MDTQGRRILLGRVHGAFGVRGELKLESFTDPARSIFRYQPWILRDGQGRERELDGVRGREGGKGLVATFPGVEDREAAEALRGAEVWVPRSALPPPVPEPVSVVLSVPPVPPELSPAAPAKPPLVATGGVS